MVNHKLISDYSVLGIEFGSTRIKAVLVDQFNHPLAIGIHQWENHLIDGIWTYSKENIWDGLRLCYGDLKQNVLKQYGIKLKKISAIGISGMMHGYIALDENRNLLVPFRTWRNTMTKEASEKLTELFQFAIPQRWSIAHLYQAILNNEPHVGEIASLTTLAGYVHCKLTDRLVLGIGEASGVFPIDSSFKNYHYDMIEQFNGLLPKAIPWKLEDILPRILTAGVSAGVLTETGARLLDPSGDLEPGILFCPPEGDAGTGMVATNAIKPRTGNISAGTSVFSMVVLEKPLSKPFDTIDIVTTPVGDPVAMVHVNNCTSDINAWESFIEDVLHRFGLKESSDAIYASLFQSAFEGDSETGGLLTFNYFSGEHITGLSEGKPILIRKPDSIFSLANLMKANLFSSVAVLRIGMDILLKQERVKIDSITGHGGLFRTPVVGQRILASAIDAPISVMSSAGEGGPFGMAVLANFMLQGTTYNSLEEYLDQAVFKDTTIHTEGPDSQLTQDFNRYLEQYIKGLPVEKQAIRSFKKESTWIETVKQRVFRANLELVKRDLVVYTWGNVSERDPKTGYVVIKPSGVDYETMRPEDMVVLDINGKIIEGSLKPSSDTPTHLEIYRKHPEIGGIVHTHSAFATAYAQAGKELKAYGTTHADYFHGDVPVTRALTESEIDVDYELNTGKVINEILNRDALRVPGVLVKNHGPFSFGKDASDAVYHAVVMEEIARMNLMTERINPEVERVEQYLVDKHYERKHGVTAYYGQGEKK
jgi:L-ribulose-5-phosphate 4-epimerase